ncbi:MAG TPA: hypothetical protein VGO68_11730 [Pyrinomonadaceae bacterium]|jgi:hypothetical protein|nr:hypothetical protein [Pyrinomonadaceae bacterium]
MAFGLWGILALLSGIGYLVCLIIVLIKQFQDAGVVHGIIGIVTCGIWTFIWGWMNASRLNLRNIMLIWTLFIIVRCVLYFMVGGMMIAQPMATP